MAPPSWVENYQNHSVWAILDEIVDVTSHRAPSDVEATTYQPMLDHIRLVAKEATGFRNSSPVLISENALNALTSAAIHLRDPLLRWKEEEDDSIINTAYAYLPELQDIARVWPTGSTGSMKSAAAAIREAVKAADDSVEFLSGRLEKTDKTSAAALSKHLEAAQTEFQAVLERVAEVEETTNDRFTEIAAEARRVEGVIAAAENRANQLADSLQNQFQSAEGKRANTHAELVSRHETKLNDFLDEQEEQFRKFRDDEETAFNSARRRVNELKDQVEKTVGAVGTTATAEWYKVHAEEQRKTANIWRKVAIAMFVLAFAVVAYSAFFSESETDSWKATILKSTATASLIAGALYASRESGKHREAEFQSKKTELTLRALDPFIATIDDKPRAKLRQEAARRVFSLDNGYVPNEIVEEDQVQSIEA